MKSRSSAWGVEKVGVHDRNQLSWELSELGKRQGRTKRYAPSSPTAVMAPGVMILLSEPNGSAGGVGKELTLVDVSHATATER